MLEHRTYDANPAEREAVETLLERYRAAGMMATVTRTEPGETGPLRVEVTGAIGEMTWLVAEDGTVTDLSPIPGTGPVG